jgi:pimeloyl-ACP methyl ester carboxylesterase
MADFNRGTVVANGLRFEYLEVGEGPLALCMHGFPDTAYSYRHLLPALADAGFHAVAPFARGFAPTELPALRHHIHSSVMVADQIELTRALGGGADALLVAHDWGAVGAWGALSRAPELWGRAVIFNIPPFEILGENLGTYEQIKKSFYFWYFQMQRVIEERIRQDDFAFIRDIWSDWSPGYDAEEDMAHIRDALGDPDHLRAGLGYYWGQFDPTRFGSPEWADEQASAWGGNVPQPILYLHGTNDGCHGMTAEKVQRVTSYAGPGSEAELIDGVGHFLMVEKPSQINQRVVDWLKRTPPMTTAARQPESAVAGVV